MIKFKAGGRRVFQVLVLSTISVLAAVFLAEALLHLFPRLMPIELQVLLSDRGDERGNADSRIGNLPQPGSTGVIRTRDFEVEHRIDAHGFRNPDPWPDRADIVVIGDSLVFGYGVTADLAWPEVLESELPGLSVINLGLIGAGPQQYRRVYDTFGRGLRPRLVIVAMFAANDFWDAEMFEAWLASGVGGNYLEWRDFGRDTLRNKMRRPLRRLQFFLRRESRVYNLLRFARQTLWRNRTGVQELRLQGGVTLQLNPGSLTGMIRNATPPGATFDIVVQSIQAIHDSAAADGAKTLVVLQPCKEEVYMALAGMPPPDPGAALRKALAGRNIEYLDLGPAFRRRAAAGGALFFAHDGHPNESGHGLTAREVAEYVKHRGVPGSGRGKL